jgi:hypothetical protein
MGTRAGLNVVAKINDPIISLAGNGTAVVQPVV